MKLHGKSLVRNVKTVVIPRPDGPLVFKMQAVLDYDEFDKLCPTPEPPTVKPRDKPTFQDIYDEKYQAAITEWAGNKTNWMILKSLEVTEGLEWETVKLSDYTTWGNFRQELIDAYLTPGEIATIITAVTEVCGLSSDKIEEATQAFLVAQAQAENESSKDIEH
jgi:hypothetical protein